MDEHAAVEAVRVRSVLLELVSEVLVVVCGPWVREAVLGVAELAVVLHLEGSLLAGHCG